MLPPTYIVTLGYCWPVIISKLYFVSLLKEDSSLSYCPLSVHGWSVYIVWMLGFAQSFSACVPVQNCLTLVLDIFYFYFPFFFFLSKESTKILFPGEKFCAGNIKLNIYLLYSCSGTPFGRWKTACVLWSSITLYVCPDVYMLSVLLSIVKESLTKTFL